MTAILMNVDGGAIEKQSKSTTICIILYDKTSQVLEGRGKSSVGTGGGAGNTGAYIYPHHGSSIPAPDTMVGHITLPWDGWIRASQETPTVQCRSVNPQHRRH